MCDDPFDPPSVDTTRPVNVELSEEDEAAVAAQVGQYRADDDADDIQPPAARPR